MGGVQEGWYLYQWENIKKAEMSEHPYVYWRDWQGMYVY